jgi:hypothetical protein
MRRPTNSVVVLMLAVASAASAVAQHRATGEHIEQGSAPAPHIGAEGVLRHLGRSKALEADEHQRSLYLQWRLSADQARNYAHALQGPGTRWGVEPEKYRQQAGQLKEAVTALQQNHDELIQSLRPQQSSTFSEHMRAMGQLRDQVSVKLAAIDDELNWSRPDERVLTAEGSRVEKAVSAWTKLQREVGDAMGLER